MLKLKHGHGAESLGLELAADTARHLALPLAGVIQLGLAGISRRGLSQLVRGSQA